MYGMKESGDPYKTLSRVAYRGSCFEKIWAISEEVIGTMCSQTYGGVDSSITWKNMTAILL